jgi:hypothetical protein
MNGKAILITTALVAVGFAGVVTVASAQDLGCDPNGNSLGQVTPPDTSNPHFFNLALGVGVAQTEDASAFGSVAVFSTNNPPCDLIGSDGDNEQGIGGAQMPIQGATCPYSQDIKNEQAGGPPITVGHHGDDIYATNTANIDVAWLSGIDGQDPAATLAGQTCTGNGVISNDATTDPADCIDEGSNINLLSSWHEDSDPLSVGTNDPNSGFTCLDAVDGNEWTFLYYGPFVGTNPGNGALLFIGNPTTDAPCVDTGYTGGATDNGCVLGVNLGWAPPTPNGVVGLSLPISGTIASGVEVDGDGADGSINGPAAFTYSVI